MRLSSLARSAAELNAGVAVISEHSLSAFRENVAAAFKAGMEAFPHYTLHGKEHLDEVDRLARMIADAIPKLRDNRERTNVLRLALVLHDLAMVDAPDRERAPELAKQIGPDLSFADVVRKTHQDEVARCLTERANGLTATFPGASPHEFEDALTIARFHRFHPLTEAPAHVRDLCALMRLIDELDIGPNRAPHPAYQALRSRMAHAARFHWLKHICTRSVDRDATFTVETCNERRWIGLWVAVRATARTWQPLQDRVVGKIEHSLAEEGVRQVIKDALGVEFCVEKSRAHLSGEAAVLSSFVREDLEALIDTGFLSVPPDVGAASEGLPLPAEPLLAGVREPPAPISLPRQRSGSGGSFDLGTCAPLRMLPRFGSDREFPILAVPPEVLPEVLCRSGRLTVIENTFVPPDEKHVGGVAGAPSRFYVGPADCGKTRAAAEWIRELTRPNPAAWVVLRTDMGTVPNDMDRIILDKSFYEERQHQFPQRAVLFLDDLPANLPEPGSELSPTEAVRRLFAWFAHIPYFRERRVVGTIRLEDMHARPGWPDVLPTLGHELELVTAQLSSQHQYRKLWEGMSRAVVVPAETDEKQALSVEMNEAFLDGVAQREANPEAVAFFLRESARRGDHKLGAKDVGRFGSSAADTWLRETWPAILQSYGPAARVFYTLARFLEAGLRPKGGFQGRLYPAWAYHEAFGPALCETAGCRGEDYLPVLSRLGSDGHAVGRHAQWIRPKWDFLLQAEELPGVEVELPAWDWFAEQSAQIEESAREALATHLAHSGQQLSALPITDVAWMAGWAWGRQFLAAQVQDTEERRRLRDEVVEACRKVVRAEPRTDWAWYNLGYCLSWNADEEQDAERRGTLREEGIRAYRKAVDANPNNDPAWHNLGLRLCLKADEERDAERRGALRDEAIKACRNAVTANPKNGWAWNHLAVCLGRKADDEEDVARRGALRDDELDAYRKAVEANPKDYASWHNIGVELGKKADEEQDAERCRALREDRIQAYVQAVAANPRNDLAWNDLGVCLGQKGDEEQDAQRRGALRDEAIKACRNAVTANMKNDLAWYHLGVCLGTKADEEQDAERREALRDEEIGAYRKAVETNPKDEASWNNLSSRLGQKADEEQRAEQREAFRAEGLEAARKAVEANTTYHMSWQNLGVSLGREADEEEHAERRAALREEELAAYGKAVELNPNNDGSWCNIAIRLAQKADVEQDAERRAAFRDAVIEACRNAVKGRPNNQGAWRSLAATSLKQWHDRKEPSLLEQALEAAAKAAELGASRYNLACAQVLLGRHQEALDELARCLERNEIERSHVAEDPDWEQLRDHPRYRQLIGPHGQDS